MASREKTGQAVRIKESKTKNTSKLFFLRSWCPLGESHPYGLASRGSRGIQAAISFVFFVRNFMWHNGPLFRLCVGFSFVSLVLNIIQLGSYNSQRKFIKLTSLLAIPSFFLKRCRATSRLLVL